MRLIASTKNSSPARKSCMEALRFYRDKDIIEKCFDDLKNRHEMITDALD